MKVLIITLIVVGVVCFVQAEKKEFKKEGLVIVFHSERLIKPEAAKVCENEGAFLGKIPNQKVQDFIFEKAKELRASRFLRSQSLWFGYTCRANDLKAVWADGDLVTYKNCGTGHCYKEKCRPGANQWMFSVRPCPYKKGLNPGEWFRAWVQNRASFFCTHDE